MPLTAYEAMTFTAIETNKIRQLKQAIATGAIKEKDLPADTLKRLTPENEKNLHTANQRASAQVYEQLKEWYQ